MKADLFTYFVYTLFMLSMVAIPSGITRLDLLAEKQTKIKIAGFFLILVYVLIIGLRFEVGTDYDVYLGWFKTLKSSGKFPVENADWGYVWLNEFLVKIDAPFPTLFVIIALFQVYFLFKAMEKMSFLLPYYFFFFFTTLFIVTSMNHMRQTMAYHIFFYTISLYFDKKYLRIVLLLLLAVSIHKSVIMYLWLYPFLKYDWYKNRYIQFALLIVVAFTADRMFSLFLSVFSQYAGFLSYDHYIEKIDMINEISAGFATGAGLGKFLYLILDSIIVWYSLELKETYKDYRFHSFYNMYFTGAILETVFASNYIFARTVDYMSYFRILILSFLLYHLIQKNTHKVQNYSLVVLVVLMLLAFFYRGIYSSAANCSPFKFISAF